jgi:thiamine pyrophosphate-dependent acetolactate synthase large subunit-like protein
MAADGYSRLSSGKAFGVAAMQSQAGAENSVGGLAQANADNVPILVLPGGNPLQMQHVRPNLAAVRGWETVVRRIEPITSPEQTASVMRRAFHVRSGRPGPVAVEMPADVCAGAVPEEARTYRAPVPVRSAPPACEVEDAIAALLEASEPLIWAGSGVLCAGASHELRTLAELLDAPVYTTMPGKSAIDERHPLALGAGGMTTTGPAREWLDAADVVFAVGSSRRSRPGRAGGRRI